jgi:hypothetical protein
LTFKKLRGRYTRITDYVKNFSQFGAEKCSGALHAWGVIRVRIQFLAESPEKWNTTIQLISKFMSKKHPEVCMSFVHVYHPFLTESPQKWNTTDTAFSEASHQVHVQKVS